MTRWSGTRSCPRPGTSPSSSGSPCDAAHRRSGVASALLAEVVEVAGRTEADRLLLEVREDNQAALAFYAGSGFTEIDRRPRYYADGATAVVLRLAGVRGTGTMAR